MNAESENSNLSQHLVNGDNDFSLDSSQSARLDSPLNENKSFSDAKDSVSGVSSHHIEEPTSRPKPPSNLQLSQEPRVYSPTTSASSTLQSSTQGYSSTAPLRRVDSRSFQPAPSQRPQNPLNFQPSQNWQPRSNSGQFSPVEYRPPPQQYQPSSQQYQPANQQYQSGQYQQSSPQYQPVQQYQPRSQPQFQQGTNSTADSTRNFTSFSPSSPTSPPLTSAPSPRPVAPGALSLRRASPWSLLREKFPPTDLTRPRLRSFQYPNYSSMNPQPIQTPPPPPPPSSTQIQQDVQRKPENEPVQRTYLSQEPANKNIDMMRVRSPMMQNSGRDSPTMGSPQYSSPTPGQGPPSPRPPVAPMQRTDSMSAMRNDPRLQQPYAPRPPRSPNKFDDDDVVMGDPRMNLGRGSPRPPVPFNKFQGQDLPKNMTPPPGEPVKYMTRPETPDRSSPMNQTYTRSPMPNNYQNSPLGTPTPPNYGTPKMSPSPIMMGSSPQSYLSKSPNPSSTDRSSHESPNMMSGKSTPEQMSRTPEVPKASPTPPPPAPTKPPEVPTKPPETPSRSSTPSERPSTPSKISPQSSNERPNTIRRSPSGRDTPFFNGVSSENSSGRTSRTESSQEGVLNAKNLEKSEENRSTPQRKRLISSSKSKDGDHDSGVDESTQGNEATTNGDIGSPKKSPTKIPAPKKLSMTSPTKTPTKTTPKTPEAPSADKKKVPMNKVQVGAAPSPNLKTVTSKIGSLQNTSYKPGGGKVKIENRKLDWKANPKIAAKNDTYTPGGGDKKETQPVPIPQPSVTIKPKKKASMSRNNGEQIQQVKLQWNAKSKIGSLENATHKPGGGDKKIESVKLDFKDKAKPKIGSKDNMKHVPGGGTVKNTEENGQPVQIEEQKLEIKASSKIGSLDNVKHRPGGGDKKIFDDKEYLKQMGTTSKTGSEGPSGTQGEDGASTDVSRNVSRQASRSRDRRQMSQSSIIREGSSSNQSGGHQSRRRTRDNKEITVNETNNNGVSTKKSDDVEVEDGTKKNEAGLEGEQENGACKEEEEEPHEENGSKVDGSETEAGKEGKIIGEPTGEDSVVVGSDTIDGAQKTKEDEKEVDGKIETDKCESVLKKDEEEVNDKIGTDECESDMKKGAVEEKETLQEEKDKDQQLLGESAKEELKDEPEKLETDSTEEKIAPKEEIVKKDIGESKQDEKNDDSEEKVKTTNGEKKDVPDEQKTDEKDVEEQQSENLKGKVEKKEDVENEAVETNIDALKREEEKITEKVQSPETCDVDSKEKNIGVIEEEKEKESNGVHEQLESELKGSVEKDDSKGLGESSIKEETSPKELTEKKDDLKSGLQESVEKDNCEKIAESCTVKETSPEKLTENKDDLNSELKESVEKDDCKELAESSTKEDASKKELTEKNHVDREQENKLTKEELAKTKEELNEVEIKEVDCKEMKNTSKQLENSKLDESGKGEKGVDEVDSSIKNECSSQGNKSPDKQKLETKQPTDLNRDTERSKITEKPTQFDTNIIKTLEIGSNQVDSKPLNKPGVIDGGDKNEIKSETVVDKEKKNKEDSNVKTDSKVTSKIEKQGDFKSNELSTNASAGEIISQKGASFDETDSKGQAAKNVTNGDIISSTMDKNH